MESEQVSIMLTQHEQLLAGLERRMMKIEETQAQIADLTISVREIAVSVKNMTEEQKQQGDRLRLLEQKPARLWDTAMGAIITGIIGAVLGAVVTYLVR